MKVAMLPDPWPCDDKVPTTVVSEIDVSGVADMAWEAATEEIYLRTFAVSDYQPVAKRYG